MPRKTPSQQRSCWPIPVALARGVIVGLRVDGNTWLSATLYAAPVLVVSGSIVCLARALVRTHGARRAGGPEPIDGSTE
jgi:hypothetical protein